jgi:hypothetical protein
MVDKRISSENSIIKLSFSIYSSPGAYALLLGSGTSKSAGIMTGWEIMEDLIKKLGKIKGQENLDHPLCWYSETYNKEPTYDTLLDQLTSIQSERRELLSKYFEPTDIDRENGTRIPQLVHKSIASLVETGFIKLIITTNFDRLLETALYEIGVNPYVIYHESMIRCCPPPSQIQNSCIIFKIHGDFLDMRLRNTPSELENYTDPIIIYLKRILDEFGLIICGWSGLTDIGLKNQIISRSEDAPYPIYICFRGALQPPIKELLNKPKTCAIEISDADSFFYTLNENVELLSNSVPMQLSHELLISRLRKYLGQDIYHIKLWELVKEELNKVRLEFSSKKYLTSIGSESVYLERMGNYEDDITNILDICSNLAFFGDESQGTIFKTIIEHLTSVPRSEGKSDLLKLQYYPGLLTLYISGIISIKEEKFNNLSNIILKPVLYYQEKRHPCIYKLNTRNIFNNQINRGNYQNNKNIFAPHNSHIYEILQKKLNPFFVNDLQYREYFDLFEFFFSLVFIDLMNPNLEEKEQWFPLGLYNWREEFYIEGEKPYYMDIINKWINEGNNSLYQNGFFKGSKDRLQQCLFLLEKGRSYAKSKRSNIGSFREI